MKRSKQDLKQNEVDSKAFHVGIELELCTPLRVPPVSPEDMCFEGCSCNNGVENDSQGFRDQLSVTLKDLTGNNSFKVVSDGSLRPKRGEVDTEICWNYYASKDTIKDNTKILDYLKNADARFDAKCGLHININNYLNVPTGEIDIEHLDFLFYFVAPSRSGSEFCTRRGMSSEEKYSMIYHQGKVIEFRFFSPTLNVEKLNNYVALANFIYKRLAGIDCKLNNKLTTYFKNKIKTAWDLDDSKINLIMSKLNNIKGVEHYSLGEL